MKAVSAQSNAQGSPFALAEQSCRLSVNTSGLNSNCSSPSFLEPRFAARALSRGWAVTAPSGVWRVDWWIYALPHPTLTVCGCAISIFLEEAVISSLNCQKVPFGGLIFINQALKQNDDLAEILLHFMI